MYIHAIAAFSDLLLSIALDSLVPRLPPARSGLLQEGSPGRRLSLGYSRESTQVDFRCEI